MRIPPTVAFTRRTFLGLGAAAAWSLHSPGIGAAVPLAAPLIDVHAHSIPGFWLEAARAAIVAQVGGPIGPQWGNWSVARMLEQMDANGIAYAVQSITAPGVWLGDARQARQLARRCNEFMAETAGAHPRRLGLHAALPLPDIAGSLEELAHALDVLHADGIGLMTSYGDRWLGDPAFEPVMQALDARRAVVFVHPLAPQCCSHLMPAVSPNFIEFLQDTDRAMLNLMFTGTLRRHPGIRFIFCHAGGSLPMMVGRISGLLRQYPRQAAEVPDGLERTLGQLHYDVANATTREALSALLAVVPSSQLLFGTDSPIVPVAATLRGLVPDVLTPAQIPAVARGNAERLYPRAARALLPLRREKGGT